MNKKIYIFDNEAKAQAFALTARYFEHKATRIGSAVIVLAEVYKFLMDNTQALPAAIITTAEEEEK